MGQAPFVLKLIKTVFMTIAIMITISEDNMNNINKISAGLNLIRINDDFSFGFYGSQTELPEEMIEPWLSKKHLDGKPGMKQLINFLFDMRHFFDQVYLYSVGRVEFRVRGGFRYHGDWEHFEILVEQFKGEPAYGRNFASYQARMFFVDYFSGNLLYRELEKLDREAYLVLPSIARITLAGVSK